MKNKTLKTIKEYVLLTLGVLLYCFAWSLFLIPNNLIGGGVTGIASIVQYATHGVVKIGYTYAFINIGLLIASMMILGNGFGVKTIYAVAVSSVGLNLFQSVIPAQIILDMAANGKLMCTIMGGILVGVSIGITMSQGGSTGGTDIIALIVNKYRDVSPGRMILAMDVVVILSSLLVPSYSADGVPIPLTEHILVVFYGFIYVTLCSTVVDLYLAGSKQSVQLFILSKKYDVIADTITNDLHRGVTILNGKGWYSKSDSNVIMVLTRKVDLPPLLSIIKTIDPDSFVSVSTVTGVYGKGFDKIKNKSKSK